MGTKMTAKIFLCLKSKYAPDAPTTQLVFAPDYSNPANAEWAAATPGLSFTMIVRDDVADRFESMDKFTVTFEKEDS